MINNDNLRRLRYALNLRDSEMIKIFSAADVKMHQDGINALFKREDDFGFELFSDKLFGSFLDGFIILRRGKREPRPGQPPPPRQIHLDNNRILRAMRIALELRDNDIIAIMALAKVRISKGEITALFRKETHRNYKVCGDQFLRNFFVGLGLKTRQKDS